MQKRMTINKKEKDLHSLFQKKLQLLNFNLN